MITINHHYQKLNASYLFSRISKIVKETEENNPDLEIIRLGIGDVTHALPPTIIEAFHQGVEEMSHDDTFKGYGPEQGYEFLRETIAQVDFQENNINIQADEIVVSDGSKCDVGNFQELFAQDTRIAIPDPVYPVYTDTNVMAGRTGEYDNGHYKNIMYIAATEDNDFIPPIPHQPVDLLYLCFPNNPTGATATSEQLAAYVEYALQHKALILFDAAYCEYITDPNIPKSIYAIPGATECAVEFRSFSKTAGFTGTRCAYTVIPRSCRAFTPQGDQVSLRDLWIRRHTTKFNGVSYPVQKAAAAIYTPQGAQEVRSRIDYYMENATIIRTTMQSLGFNVYGGINAPYIWIKTDMPSWDFFQKLLSTTGIVTTPGAGFGPAGEHYIRISAFNHRAQVKQAMEKITQFS